MTRSVDRPYGEPIIGTRAQVEVAIATAKKAGRLVRTDPAKPLPGGLVLVEAVWRAPVRVRRRIPARAWWWTAGILAGCALVGGLAWLIVVAVSWVLAHWAVILALLAVGFLVAGALGRTFAKHCPGCEG